MQSMALGGTLQLTADEAAEVLELEGRYRTQGLLHPKQGLLSALTRWSTFVAAVEKGYPYALYEYCADLEARRSIQCLLDDASPSLASRIETVVKPWDAQFTKATERSATPVWRGEYWWGWRVPTKRGPILDRQVAQYMLPG